MPVLDWIGKDKVINHHLDVPYRVLDWQYSYDVDGQQEEDNGSENMIIHGDNLIALKSLLPRYEGRIKCIYIDPPYNTGESSWVYNDNVDDPRIKQWLGKVVGAEGEDLSRHDKWLCMMYPRLKLLHRLLSTDGLIFISIDDHEQANLKMICDDIMGPQNFMAVLVWKSRAKPSNTGDAKYKPQNDAEYILCYKKYDDPKFSLVTSGNSRSYPHHDEDGNYRLQTILKSNRGESKRDTMRFSLNGYTPPETKRWQAAEEKIQELWDKNRITFETGEPMLKYYEHEEKAETAPFWCYVPKDVSSTAEKGKEDLNKILGNLHGFDTVKPKEIIEYILRHSIGKDDIVLDSFAGSGTTAHAVLELNKEDGGHRHFIMIEMEDYADSITAERVKRVITGYKKDTEEILYRHEIKAKDLKDGPEILEEAKSVMKEARKNGEFSKVSQPKLEDNYLTVVGTKKGEDFEEELGGDFSYYELGAPLLIDGNLNENAEINKIREYVYYMDTKAQPIPVDPDEQYLLGVHYGTAYYFYYDKDSVTTLNRESLHMVKKKADSYVIYADLCMLSNSELEKFHITFKKIPRDISRL